MLLWARRSAMGRKKDPSVPRFFPSSRLLSLLAALLLILSPAAANRAPKFPRSHDSGEFQGSQISHYFKILERDMTVRWRQSDQENSMNRPSDNFKKLLRLCHWSLRIGSRCMCVGGSYQAAGVKGISTVLFEAQSDLFTSIHKAFWWSSASFRERIIRYLKLLVLQRWPTRFLLFRRWKGSLIRSVCSRTVKDWTICDFRSIFPSLHEFLNISFHILSKSGCEGFQ